MNLATHVQTEKKTERLTLTQGPLCTQGNEGLTEGQESQ